MWTYAPSEVTVAIAGKHLTGFADNAFVRITRENPLHTSKMAMDGSVSVTKQRYSKWTVTISLAQSSPSNNFLDGLQKILTEKNITAFQFIPLIIKDNSGSTMFFAKEIWLDSVPEQTFGSDMNLRDWVITCNNVESIIGGNAEDIDDVTKAIQAAGVILDVASSSSVFVKSIGRML